MTTPFPPHTLTYTHPGSPLPPCPCTGYAEAKAAGIVPELTLLTDITGSFRPGILTALMGVSGAGKVRAA